MISALLACLLVAGGPAGETLEAALFVPNPGGVTVSGGTVLQDATHGVTLLPDVPPDRIAAFFDGTDGRYLVSAAAALDRDPVQMRLPLSAGELSYVGLRDGRPQTFTVANPAAVNVGARRVEEQAGRLALTFEVVQLEAQREVPGATPETGGTPVFSRRRFEVEQTLGYQRPLVVLLATDAELQIGGRRLEVTFRRQVGRQWVEAPAPLLGVVLRLAPPGAGLRYDRVQAPVAPPGNIAVLGAAARPGQYVYEPGQKASQVLGQAGVEAETRIEVARLKPDGGIDRFELPNAPAAGGPDDFELQERDQLVVAPDRRQAAPAKPGPAGESKAMTAQGAEPPREAAPPAPAPAPAGTNAQVQARPGGWMPLETLQRVAPAAARAAESVVALTGRLTRDGRRAEILMAGTVVSADGLVLTAPASALAGVEEWRAQTTEGREVACERVGVDATGALLALRLATGGLTPVRLAAHLPEPGTPVVVMGHPYGLLRSLTVTVIGGPPRHLPALPGVELQLDGALASGNSGGPVVGLDGRLVGLAYGTIRADEPGPAIGLAVPAHVIETFLRAVQSP